MIAAGESIVLSMISGRRAIVVHRRAERPQWRTDLRFLHRGNEGVDPVENADRGENGVGLEAPPYRLGSREAVQNLDAQRRRPVDVRKRARLSPTAFAPSQIIKPEEGRRCRHAGRPDGAPYRETMPRKSPRPALRRQGQGGRAVARAQLPVPQDGDRGDADGRHYGTDTHGARAGTRSCREDAEAWPSMKRAAPVTGNVPGPKCSAASRRRSRSDHAIVMVAIATTFVRRRSARTSLGLPLP